MKEENFFRISLILVLILSVAVVNVSGEVNKVASASPKVYLDPAMNTASPGETFTVDIKVAEVANLYTYGLYMNWSGPILNVTSITEGDFLKEGGDTYFIPAIFNKPDPEGISDYISVGCTLLAPATEGVDGSGILATVEFLVEGEGISTLDIYYVELIDTWGGHIKHTMEDGTFVFPLPKLGVDPQFTVDPTLSPGTEFTVNVNVTDIVDLYGFEFKLSYNTTLLSATAVAIVPFLDKPTTNFTEIDDAAGYIRVNVTSNAPAEPVSGEGTLATITFLVEDHGISILKLYDTTLVDQNLLDIPHAIVDGAFNNEQISVSILLSIDKTSVTIGDSVTISGSISPSQVGVDVKIWYRLSEEETWSILETVQTDQTSQYSYTWTPSDLGTYKIKAAWEGDEISPPVESNTWTVKVEAAPGLSIPFYVIVGIVIVVAIAAAVLIYFMRVRKTA